MPGQQRHATFTSRAVAYLKARVSDAVDEAIVLSHDDSPVLRAFVEPLLVSYAVDAGDHYELVQNRHLAKDGIDEQALHQIGVANLAAMVDARATRVHPYGNIFAVTMGGDFEASLILVDSLWDEHYRQFVNGDYAIAVPARDVLAFCDAGSSTGLQELREVVERAFPTGDHLLSDRLFVRRERVWTHLVAN